MNLKEAVAKGRPQEHEPAARPGMGDERASQREIQCHRKTCQVEPGGSAGKTAHLTRGGLLRKAGGEVSRGHSSEDGTGNCRVAKGRRAKRQTSQPTPPTPESRLKRRRNPRVGGNSKWIRRKCLRKDCRAKGGREETNERAE